MHDQKINSKFKGEMFPQFKWGHPQTLEKLKFSEFFQGVQIGLTQALKIRSYYIKVFFCSGFKIRS